MKTTCQGNQTSKTSTTGSSNDGTTSYVYDSLNRLERVTEPNGKSTSYTYDEAGNRKTETVTVGQNSITTVYTYDEQNRLIKTEATLSATEIQRVIYTYDNNGNMISKVQSTLKAITEDQTLPQFEVDVVRDSDYGTGSEAVTLYTYDKYNRLIALKQGATTSTYAYNAEDYRISKTINNQTTLYLYEADKVVLETDETGENQLAINVYGTNLLYRSVVENSATEEYFYLYRRTMLMIIYYH